MRNCVISLLRGDSPGQKKNLRSFSSLWNNCTVLNERGIFLSHQFPSVSGMYLVLSLYLYYYVCFFLDTLSKDEFHLKQNVEPFIHYKEKHATFECITRENIEAVAAKVCQCVCVCTCIDMCLPHIFFSIFTSKNSLKYHKFTRLYA